MYIYVYRDKVLKELVVFWGVGCLFGIYDI